MTVLNWIELVVGIIKILVCIVLCILLVVNIKENKQ